MLEWNITISHPCAAWTRGYRGQFYSWRSFHNDYSCNWNVQENERFQCDSSNCADASLLFHRGCTWSMASHPQELISPCTGRTPPLHQIVLKDKDHFRNHFWQPHVSFCILCITRGSCLELQSCLGLFLTRTLTWDSCMEEFIEESYPFSLSQNEYDSLTVHYF